MGGFTNPDAEILPADGPAARTIKWNRKSRFWTKQLETVPVFDCLSLDPRDPVEWTTFYSRWRRAQLHLADDKLLQLGQDVRDRLDAANVSQTNLNIAMAYLTGGKRKKDALIECRWDDMLERACDGWQSTWNLDGEGSARWRPIPSYTMMTANSLAVIGLASGGVSSSEDEGGNYSGNESGDGGGADGGDYGGNDGGNDGGEAAGGEADDGEEDDGEDDDDDVQAAACFSRRSPRPYGPQQRVGVQTSKVPPAERTSRLLALAAVGRVRTRGRVGIKIAVAIHPGTDAEYDYYGLQAPPEEEWGVVVASLDGLRRLSFHVRRVNLHGEQVELPGQPSGHSTIGFGQLDAGRMLGCFAGASRLQMWYVLAHMARRGVLPPSDQPWPYDEDIEAMLPPTAAGGAGAGQRRRRPRRAAAPSPEAHERNEGRRNPKRRRQDPGA